METRTYVSSQIRVHVYVIKLHKLVVELYAESTVSRNMVAI